MRGPKQSPPLEALPSHASARTLPKKYFEEISATISTFGIHGLIIIGGFEVSGVAWGWRAPPGAVPLTPHSSRPSWAAWS